MNKEKTKEALEALGVLRSCVDIISAALTETSMNEEMLKALKNVLSEWEEDNKNDGFGEHFEQYCSVIKARKAIARAEAQKVGV